MKTAEEILLAAKCGDLFSQNTEQVVKAEYRQMAKVYHPDTCKLPNATDVFKKINEMYMHAMELIKVGKWEMSNMLSFHSAAGKEYRTYFLRSVDFELGTMYAADKSVTYMLDQVYKKYFDNALEQIKKLKYANGEMEKEISRYMPNIRFSFDTDDGKHCLILNKTPDVFLLSDVLKHYNGSIPDRHVAWIISRLCNLCCYFGYAGIVHHGLTLENILISPQYHTLMPYGGWWYTRNLGDKLLGVSKSVYDVMPVKAKGDKAAVFQTDLESVKMIGRQLLGTESAPQAMLDYLNSGSSTDPMKEFEIWNKALDAAYGKRKFVEMPVTKTDIYK